MFMPLALWHLDWTNFVHAQAPQQVVHVDASAGVLQQAAGCSW
jgi:hypothetical protein